ncbi:MAG: MBL fold metallo-hydrolase [Chloroflexi bacterium]|nr:MBL fold metallo-hydrolase [Chloroflexota bacterium]
MSLTIYKMTLGPVSTNCYIVGDDATGDAVVIDPADRAELIHHTAQEAGWTIREILVTHAHFDHVMAVDDLKALTGAPFRLHQLDLPLLHNMPRYVQMWMGMDVPPAGEPDRFVQEGDTITVGPITLDVLFTPGHAPGHVSYVLRSEQAVFCGDVLFRDAVGRTDLPGSDADTLMESITRKLLPLGDDFAVLPGHGANTTIGEERASNPFILDYLRRHPTS